MVRGQHRIFGLRGLGFEVSGVDQTPKPLMIRIGSARGILWEGFSKDPDYV